MRKLLLLFALLLTATSRSEIKNALVLHTTKGNDVTILLEERPIMFFSDNNLVVKTHMNMFHYPFENLLSFSYKNVISSAVDRLRYLNVTFTFKGNTIIASNLSPLTNLSIYKIDGVLVSSVTADENGSAEVLLQEQAGAVFVIKTSSTTFKIVKPTISRWWLRVIIKNGTKGMMALVPLAISGCKGDYSCTGIFFTRRS